MAGGVRRRIGAAGRDHINHLCYITLGPVLCLLDLVKWPFAERFPYLWSQQIVDRVYKAVSSQVGDK